MAVVYTNFITVVVKDFGLKNTIKNKWSRHSSWVWHMKQVLDWYINQSKTLFILNIIGVVDTW